MWQKALNVLHLENYVLVQITFIQDKILIKVGLIKSLKDNIDFTANYDGKNANGFPVHGESFSHSKHEQTFIGIKYCESNGSGRTVNKKSQLTCQHMFRGEKLLDCSYCKKAFGSKSRLPVRQQAHRQENPCDCCECGKVCSRRDQLLSHQRTQLGQKSCGCDECGKAFDLKSQLIIHQIIHSGEKPYECCECWKAFSTKSNLMVHQRTHTREKPYSCGECGKAFMFKSQLIVHQGVHIGVKPYACLQCGKAFSVKSQLVIHQRSHTGDTPYVCSECSKAFRSKSYLVVHRRLKRERSFTNAVIVGKSLVLIHNLLHIGGFTQERTPMNATNVGVRSDVNTSSSHIRELMQGKGLMNVVPVG